MCLRLWSEEDHTQLLPCTPPEILGADLTPLALQLAGWGCLADGGGSLPWLDPPPPDALADARTLLEDLGAVDTSGAVTPTGALLTTTENGWKLAAGSMIRMWQ